MEVKRSADEPDPRKELVCAGTRQRRLRRTVLTLAKGIAQREGLRVNRDGTDKPNIETRSGQLMRP